MNVPSFWKTGLSGSAYTSMKVGGPLDYVARVTSLEELKSTLQFCMEEQVPLKILGGGSDTVLSDAGLRGVLVLPAFHQINPLTTEEQNTYLAQFPTQLLNALPPQARYAAEQDERFLRLSHDDVAVSGEEAWIEMGAGVPWGQAVMMSIRHQLCGLHWFARIPCQVGGAVYNNIHAEKHFLSEYTVLVKSVDLNTGEVIIRPGGELRFGYDFSLFHEVSECITSVIFRLTRVSLQQIEQTKQQYIDWTKQKTKVQPAGANAGSVFQNLTPEHAQQVGQEAVAAAWYIDHCGLKGKQVGGMQVYPGHANFIINTDGGTQADFIHLVEEIRQVVHTQFGFWLVPEVECVDEWGKRYQWQS